MKKLLIALLILVIGAGGAFLFYNNRPIKRHARHIIKARLYAGEGNLTAARLEYEKAYNITGEYTPWASIEVLTLTNKLNLQEKNLKDALENTRKFSAQFPDNNAGLVMLAELAFQSADLPTAFGAVESALNQDKVNFPARMLLARLRTQQGRLDLAEEQLRVLAKSFPDSLPPLMNLAENLLRQGQTTESRAFLNQALVTHPDNEVIRMLLVDTYLLERKTDSAQAMLEALQKDSPAKEAQSIAIRRSRLSSLTGDTAAARAALRPYLEKKEDNIPAFTEMALFEATQGRYDSSIKIYGLLEDIRPAARGDFLRVKAYLFLKNRNSARALEALKMLAIGDRASRVVLSTMTATYIAMDQQHKIKELIATQPDSVRPALEAFAASMPSDKEFIGQWALVNYFQAHQHAGGTAQAIRDFYKGWPKSTLAISLHTSQLMSTRNYAEAAKVLETYPNPGLPQQVILLTAYSKAGKGDKAKALAEKLLAAHPGQRGLNLYLADFYLSRKDAANAARHYEAELAIDTGSVVALNNLAWHYGITMGDLPKAKPYLERLRSKQALDPRILDTIGWILAKNGDPEGMKLLTSALNLIPDHPTFNYHVAWALSQKGDKQGAKSHLDVALTTKFPFEERPDAEKLAASL